jgi:hypothetical protein
MQGERPPQAEGHEFDPRQFHHASLKQEEPQRHKTL